MSKISIANVFEISKALATKAGAELQAPLEFLSDFGEQALRALRNGLTLRNNFDADIKTVELTHATDQVIFVAKTPQHIFVTRTISATAFVTSFGWYFNDNGELVVNCSYVGAPTDPIQTQLVILF